MLSTSQEDFRQPSTQDVSHLVRRCVPAVSAPARQCAALADTRPQTARSAALSQRMPPDQHGTRDAHNQLRLDLRPESSRHDLRPASSARLQAAWSPRRQMAAEQIPRTQRTQRTHVKQATPRMQRSPQRTQRTQRAQQAQTARPSATSPHPTSPHPTVPTPAGISSRGLATSHSAQDAISMARDTTCFTEQDRRNKAHGSGLANIDDASMHLFSKGALAPQPQAQPLPTSPSPTPHGPVVQPHGHQIKP